MVSGGGFVSRLKAISSQLSALSPEGESITTGSLLLEADG
jgi:hypothetical protein